jgi:hypothetical protein
VPSFFFWLLPSAVLICTLYLVATGKSRARIGHYVVSCGLLFAGMPAIFYSPWPGRTALAVMAAYIGWAVLGYRVRIYDR